MKYSHATVDTFQQFMAQVGDFRDGSGLLWFRGISKKSHKLLPSMFRIQGKDDLWMKRAEREMLQRFRERALPFLVHSVTSPWEWLFLMQHYGVPTRLLDWTENPFVALYFALQDPSDDEDAVVWALRPERWNQKVLHFQSYSEGVLAAHADQLSEFQPPCDFVNTPEWPLALFGSHNSARIVAQRGAFVIFGRKSRPMEDYHSRIADLTEPLLHQIIVKRAKRKKIRDELLCNGFTESTVFPDLDGLAKEIKRTWGY